MEFLGRDIKHADGKIATYTAGMGPVVVFLHGGPGDTHHYLRKMVEPLRDEFTCVLYDQRGTGGSQLSELTYETLAIERHLEDLELIRNALGGGKLTLVGHSWGASLALMMACHKPESVEKVALLSMGPLDEEMASVTSANLEHVLLPMERLEWQRLRKERKDALATGNEEWVLSIDEALMELRVRAWIYRPELRESFLKDYFEEPPPNRVINQFMARDALRFFRWSDLDRLRARVLIGQGVQDYVPLQQAFRIRERVGRVEIRLWNECAHLPWYDQPDLFYWDLKSFLTS